MSRNTAADVRVDWKLALACALVLSVLFTLQAALSTVPARSQTIERVFGGQIVIWLLWVALAPLIFRIARRARAQGSLSPRVVLYQILAGVAVAMLHAVLGGVTRWLLGWSVTPDLGVAIINSMGASIAANIVRFWLIAAVYHGIAYHRELREREVAAAELVARLAEARLENLERRLHPHFLFNTLNVTAALIRDDPRAAETMIGHLSELLRAALAAEPGREVTLERELHLLGRYVAIQQMRFQDRLQVSVRAAPDTVTSYVPHLILQPLVENAIQHGIGNRESGGTVQVRATRVGATLRLLVEDDGVGFGGVTDSVSGDGVGISSTRARLAQLYGDRFVFEVSEAAPHGTVITIDLPFHTDPVRVGEHVA